MKRNIFDVIFDTANCILLALLSLTCLYPFYYILNYSVSDPLAASVGKAILYPVKLTFHTYKIIFAHNEIYSAVLISIARTLIGAGLTIICCSFFSYLLTKKQLQIRKILYRFCVITMYFNAGIIPYYITMKYLGLKDNFLLYILPTAISAFYVVLYKTYIEQMPPDLEESAMVDGAGILRTFAVVIFPLCGPITATIFAFSAVVQWNSWYDNMLLITNHKLDTLQYILYQYLASALASSVAARENTGLSLIGQSRATAVTPVSIQMTITVIAVLPIFFVYPFMQKYFAKGIMIGAIKG